MTRPRLQIDGLRQFQRNLKALDGELPKALRMAFNDAADIVVSDARPRVPKRRGRARASVKARSTQTAARVVGGSRRVPYYPWLDFGGRIRSGNRPFLTNGRYIYNSFFRKRDEFEDAMVDALVTVGRQAGLEVTT